MASLSCLFFHLLSRLEEFWHMKIQFVCVESKMFWCRIDTIEKFRDKLSYMRSELKDERECYLSHSVFWKLLGICLFKLFLSLIHCYKQNWNTCLMFVSSSFSYKFCVSCLQKNFVKYTISLLAGLKKRYPTIFCLVSISFMLF